MSTVTIRVATEGDLDAMITFDGMAFGEVWPDAERAAVGPTMELDRFRVAFDGDTLVGVGGLYTLELTVPGANIVPAGGVTWIAVAPTHRRQGLLTRMIAELHDDVDAHGEPIAMLMASEGGIYERFGYGVASHWRAIEIDRRRTQIRPEYQPAPGDVSLTTFDDDRLIEIYDRYRRQRIGELSRSAERYAFSRVARKDGVTVAIHRDGYATWKTAAKWYDGHPAFEMALLDMVAITPEAHAALWHTVLSVDLVGPIRSEAALAVDDVLPYLLTDPRAVRTTNLNDMMWLHLRDVRRALAARTYGTTDEFVVEVDLGDTVGRWRVNGSPDGAEVRKVRNRPDLSMDRATLGAIYLGGVRPSVVERAGRLRAASPDVLRRADAFFAADRLPHSQTGF